MLDRQFAVDLARSLSEPAVRSGQGSRADQPHRATRPSLLLVRPGLGPKTLAELVALVQAASPARSRSAPAGRVRRRIWRWNCCSTWRAPKRCMCRSAASRRRSPKSIAGRVDMAIASLASGVAHVQAGTLLGLGVSGNARSELLPTCRPSRRRASRATTCPTGGASRRRPRTPRPIIDRLHQRDRARHARSRACARPSSRAPRLPSPPRPRR